MNVSKDYKDKICDEAIELTGDSADFDALLESIGDAAIVMLGECTHGTHQFYDMRSRITQRLIAEKGFNAITIEGDWPDAYQVNRYIHSKEYSKASDALASFDRFPTWMWRNIPMVSLIEWLKDYNQEKTAANKVDFYGLDMYSLYRSIDTVISYLDTIDANAAAEARHHYSCFDQVRHDPQAYGYGVFTATIQSCAYEVLEQLKRLQQQDWNYLGKGEISADDAFNMEQNARVVKNAEHYYRALFFDNVSTWNVRDSHMFETLNALIEHYKRKGIEKPKIIIWAHNSHIGNAAATQMSAHNEYNIGQLVKDAFGKNSFSLGFFTYTGTVSAASNWHHPVENMRLLPALTDSYESLFHDVQKSNFLLLLDNNEIVPQQLLERAVGVVYRPDTERASHYFYANLAQQFDAIIHCDKTVAVEPLEKSSRWVAGEVPEAYPSGL